MQTKRPTAAIGLLAIAAAVLASPASAQVGGDSVTGSGTMELGFVGGLTLVTPFLFDAHSGPAGEDPTGTVQFSAVGGPGTVTCLEVRTVTAGPTFNEATMNVATAGFGLVTLQVSDAAEGFPDQLRARTLSPRAPEDCSPLAFGDADVAGAVLTGDIVFVDAPNVPTSKEQCRYGGWAPYGFRNQGDCVAFIESTRFKALLQWAGGPASPR